MAENKKILVVGTSADYIEILTLRFGERLLFITDFLARSTWNGAKPPEGCELLLDLEDEAHVLDELRFFVRENGISLSGVVCYDCESLGLAARIAAVFGLPFVSAEAVKNSRSKYLSKTLWAADGVRCPGVALIHSEQEAIGALHAMGGQAVLKPLTGSGSELVFLCRTEQECLASLNILARQLEHHPNRRMYSNLDGLSGDNPRTVFLMEEYVPKEEYSCDFFLRERAVRVIRATRKIACHRLAFGTVLAYEMLDRLTDATLKTNLEMAILRAAKSLGIERCLGMVDFKVNGQDIVFLELTPRPGGDCLIPLIEASSGLDMFKASLDFAEGKPVPSFDELSFKPLLGMRLVSEKAGVIQEIDSRLIKEDPRVISVTLKRKAGERVILPPLDYDSRILGQVIFRPATSAPVEQQCLDLSKKLTLIMEGAHEPKKT